jgi:hypothetical protein
MEFQTNSPFSRNETLQEEVAREDSKNIESPKQLNIKKLEDLLDDLEDGIAWHDDEHAKYALESIREILRRHK